MERIKTNIPYLPNDFSITDTGNSSWKSAAKILVTTYWNGSTVPAGRQFETRMLWSETSLYVQFDAEQSEPLIVSEEPELAQKTMRLWDRDVCELFLAPDARNRRRYFEFEIAPTGEWLDLIVDWMKDEPRDWEYLSGMESAARIESGKVTMALKIPWTAFGRKPEAGDVWLGNIFRQVGSGATRGYLAWSPTMTPEPQFHVPEKFGKLIFVT
jgi:hypothetical protein